MKNFFSGGKADAAPAWLAELNDNRERWFVFLDKLEAKMQELCEAAIPELETMFAQDDDLYKRTYGRMLSGIQGQLSQVREKARAVQEEKVYGFYATLSHRISVLSPQHGLLEEYRAACNDRFENGFETAYHRWRERLETTGTEDLEAQYQEIIREYGTLAGSFRCKQCGSPLSIDRMYFISTYIACPACQTQNVFEPSTRAKNLELLGRKLAEQRCAGLLAAHEQEKEKERELYHQRHELSLSTIHEKDRGRLQRIREQMDELERQRREAIAKAPVLYEQYLRAMFDEWNKIVPDLTEQNEKFYQRLLADHRKYGH